jgi:3D (Asp-Asp-Asp) domain-containing protein
MLKYLRKFAKKALKLIDDRFLPICLLVVILNLSFPHVSVAQALEVEKDNLELLPLQAGEIEILKSAPLDPSLPKIEVKKPRQTVKIWITAYNSLPEQTDSDPCTTASGLNVCKRNTEDVIATNYQYLPFGTKVRFPELYGDKIFTVEDRMHQKYYNHADIWLKNKGDAKKFGRKYTVMEIL